MASTMHQRRNGGGGPLALWTKWTLMENDFQRSSDPSEALVPSLIHQAAAFKQAWKVDEWVSGGDWAGGGDGGGA